MKNLRSWLSILFLLGVLCLFYWQGIRPGYLLMPLDIVTQAWSPWQLPNQPVSVHNDLIFDIVVQIYPIKLFVTEQLRSGVLPLWNPYVALGYPLTYNTQAGIFYPLSLLIYLLKPTQAHNAFVIIQMLLGGWFMHAYLRQIGLRQLAALFGSVVFLFNGMMVVWLEWHVVHAAVIWFPLQLWGVEKIFANPQQRKWYLLLTGAAIAIPWLNGHWNWTLYLAMTLGVYILWRWAQEPTNRAALWACLAAVGIGIGLALVQILPAFVYLAQTQRGGLTWAESAEKGLLHSAIVLLIPNFFGSPVDKNWWGSSATNFNEVTLYLGILPLFLALISLWGKQSQRKFFAVWGLIGLLWTLGTIAYRPLHLLPAFNGFFPSRALTIVVVCGTISAAIGLETLLAAQRSYARIAALATTFCSALAIGFLWFQRANLTRYHVREVGLFVVFLVASALLCSLAARLKSKLLVAWLAIGIVIADLYLFGYDYNAFGSADLFYPPTETAAFLAADQEPYRIASLAQGVVYPPNVSIVDDVENISGYEPGLLSRVVNYVDLAEGGNAIRNTRALMPLKGINSPLLDAVNVKYILTTSDLWSESSLPVGDEAVVSWGNAPLTTEIVMPDAGLHRVVVPLRGDGEVTVRVISADNSYEFANASATLDGGETEVPFDFGAFPSEWGRAFLVRVEGSAEIGLNAAGEPAIVPYYLPRPKLLAEYNKVRIYENADYFPRAYAVHEALLAVDESEALALLADNAERLRDVVILEGTDQLSATAPATSTVTISDRRANGMTLAANMGADGYVVVADTFYPGWQATVDGERTEVLRANSAVRAVAVPAGEHVVEMVFRPKDFIFGATVSILTLILCLAIALGARPAKLQRRYATQPSANDK